MTLTAVPVAIAVAYLFFLVCERPFLNKPLGVQKAKREETSPNAALA